MPKDYIVPDVDGDQIVEVPGVGLVRNDMSELISAHPRKEDMVPTYLELQEALDGLNTKQLKQRASHAGIVGRSEMDRDELIAALSSSTPSEPVDIDTLLDLPLPVEDEPEAPPADTSGGDQ